MPFVVAAAALALIVIVPVAILRVWHGFDGLYGQDSFAYVDYALGPVTAALRAFSLPPASFLPPGYPMLVAIVAMVTGAGDSAGQLVSLLSGAAIPIFVALLARELLSTDKGPGARFAVPLFAGLAAAVTGHLWQSSIVAMSDTAAAALVTAGAWAVARYANSERTWAIVLGAVAIALAIEVRWVYGLVALPLGVAALIRVGQLFRRDRARAVFDAAVASVAGIVAASPALVPILSAMLNGQPPPFSGEWDVHRWDLFSAGGRTFETLDGRLEYALPTGVFYLLQPVQHYWFALLGVLAIPGLVWVSRRRTVITTAVLLAWPALVMVFLIGLRYQNTRFFLTALTPFAILVAIGARQLWLAAHQSRDAWRRRAVKLATLFLVVGLAANVVLAARFTNAFVERMVQDVGAIRTLVQRVPAGARLITLGPTAMLTHYGTPGLVELDRLDEASVMALVSDGRATYLLVDIAAIRHQWGDRGAGRAVNALETTVGIEPVAAAGIWTLFRVGVPAVVARLPTL